MDLFQKISNLFVTDIVFELTQSPDAPYRADGESGRQGAIRLSEDGNNVRVVFHGGYLLGGGSAVSLADGRGNRLVLARDSRRKVSVIAVKPDPRQSGCRVEEETNFSVGVGMPTTVTDPHGKPIRVSRVRSAAPQSVPVAA